MISIVLFHANEEVPRQVLEKATIAIKEETDGTYTFIKHRYLPLNIPKVLAEELAQVLKNQCP